MSLTLPSILAYAPGPGHYRALSRPAWAQALAPPTVGPRQRKNIDLLFDLRLKLPIFNQGCPILRNHMITCSNRSVDEGNIF